MRSLIRAGARGNNQGGRALAYNPELHQRTKHIERRHFFIRDMVEAMEITVPYVASADNLADIFTKPLKNPNRSSPCVMPS